MKNKYTQIYTSAYYWNKAKCSIATLQSFTLNKDTADKEK